MPNKKFKVMVIKILTEFKRLKKDSDNFSKELEYIYNYTLIRVKEYNN